MIVERTVSLTLTDYSITSYKNDDDLKGVAYNGIKINCNGLGIIYNDNGTVKQYKIPEYPI